MPVTCISLIGLPGVGKSTVGQRLARRLGFAFLDCDGELERRLGRRIRDFFEAEGESRFREVEAAVLDELTSSRNAVLATGGGVVLRATNRALLRERTVCVYLKADFETLLPRLQRDTKRPLLQVADPAARLRTLSEERDPLYRDVATLTVETRGKSLGSLVDAVLHGLPRDLLADGMARS